MLFSYKWVLNRGTLEEVIHKKNYFLFRYFGFKYFLSFLILVFSCVVEAHSTHNSDQIGWSSWTFSVPIILVLLFLFTIYLLSWLSTYRKIRRAKSLAQFQLIFFLLGIVTLIISLLSPLDPLSDKLAYIHMLQHTLLLMVAAPFFAIASPGFYSFREFPKFVQSKAKPFQKIFNKIIRRHPFKKILMAWLVYAFTLWIWHLPYLYEKALQVEWIHDIQHIAFFLSSYFFWRLILDPYRNKKHSEGLTIVYLFVTSLHAMILGVFMTLSPMAWYQPYILTAPEYGLTALQDQQLAGLIMWMPAGFSYVFVALFHLYQLISKQKPILNR